jgi:AraC family transcriptional regulator
MTLCRTGRPKKDMASVPRLDDPSRGQFHGGVTRFREINGAAMVATTPSDIAVTEKPMHYHARPYFWMLVDGDCAERIQGLGERIYSPMVLTYHPRGEVHHHWAGPRPPSGFGIVLSDELISTTRKAAPIPEEPMVLAGRVFAELADRILDEFQLNDDASTLALEGLTFELIAATSRVSRNRDEPSTPRWLAQAIDLIHARYADNLKFAEIAACVGIHPVHLAAEYRRRFGCTMGDSLRAVRIAAAKKCLRAGNQSVAEIAGDCGFYDESHLCRAFKAATGMTPTQYRVRAES